MWKKPLTPLLANTECDANNLSVAARSSLLSRAQLRELEAELRQYYPEISLTGTFVISRGDRDLTTSLRTLEKTDFFTREVDALVQNGTCCVSLHSAKDLPEPLPEGLHLICLTTGQNPADSLVLREGQTLKRLPSGSIIATSSERREKAVQKLRSDLRFCDIRGTIEKRLQSLEEGKVDGVIIAEAALIRLGLTHLNRVQLPGKTAALQGQLAVLAKEDNTEMAPLFACISCPLPDLAK